MRKLNQKLADLIRAVGGIPTNKYETTAILLAAGQSTRIGNGISKQMAVIGGIPVVVHSLLALERAECITSVVVVAREDELLRYDDFRKQYGLTKLLKAVKGGENRQESVMNGLVCLPETAKYVAICDAARCLILPQQIDSVCHSAYVYEAAIAATPATDTVKVLEKGGFLSTPERAKLWNAATPQVFLANLYRAAAYTARDEKFTATDDASLVERIRHPVHLVDVGHFNLKITTQEDLLLAEAILKLREQGDDAT